MAKIEYLDEEIPLNMTWKTLPTNVSHPTHYGFFPKHIEEAINQRIYERVTQLGQDGWEPVEPRFDLTWLAGRTKIYFESLGGLFRRKNTVDSIVIRFKRITP